MADWATTVVGATDGGWAEIASSALSAFDLRPRFGFSAPSFFPSCSLIFLVRAIASPANLSWCWAKSSSSIILASSSSFMSSGLKSSGSSMPALIGAFRR